MTILSEELNSLLATVCAIATHSLVHSGPGQDGTLLGAANPPRMHTMELTIPLAFDCGQERPLHQSPATRLLRLQQEALLEVEKLIAVKQLPVAVQQKMHKAIADGCRTAQGLLAKDEAAIEQVITDFAQTVLASAWEDVRKTDALKFEASKVEGVFERLTIELVQRLQQNRAWRSLPNDDQIQIIVETHQLQKMPAHALAYIKLMLGDDK